jgi:8-oxo-dGTP pyrophosphatase MutT (NUDIX family)
VLPFDLRLRRRLAENLTRFERRSLDVGDRRHAAVAVTLVPEEDGQRAAGDPGRACFVLTVRAAGLNRHSFQFALPGGRIDPGESVREAALRELEEEVGVALGPERVLGLLDDYPTRSGFVITPVVVWGDPDQALVKDPVEVAEVFRVPVEDLDAPEIPILETIPESDRPVLSVRLLGWQVFAPTAAILYQFSRVAVHGDEVRVADYDEPVFAWR